MEDPMEDSDVARFVRIFTSHDCPHLLEVFCLLHAYHLHGLNDHDVATANLEPGNFATSDRHSLQTTP